MKNILIGFGVIGIVSVMVILSYMNGGRSSGEAPAKPVQDDITSVQMAVSTSPVQPVDSALLSGGSSYKDVNNVYAILYPNDYSIDAESDTVHVRIYKTGPTQKGQTEMYDGVLMVFESVELNGKTLEQLTNDRIQESLAHGTITEAKHPITINGYKGFGFTSEGLGTSEYIIIQKDATSQHALIITMAIYDPSSVGFRTQVDTILSAIQLLK